MKLSVGTQVQYTSAAGTRKATISNIEIGPTAQPGFMNTWITLEIPVQPGVKFATRVQITGDNASLKMFKLVKIGVQ